jgi:transcriptional regulator with XRE-family HTH domain
VSNAKTAERPQLGETLRTLRLRRGLGLDEAADELGIPAKSLRALEWDRRDLVGGNGADELIQRRYAAYLGLDLGRPAVASTVEEHRPPREVAIVEWLALLAALGPPLVIAIPFLVDDVPLVTLGLVFLSSLLLLGAALPESVVARTRVSSATFARYREPLALAALGILLPVALFTLGSALT